VRLRKPVPFLVETLPTFKLQNIKCVLDLGCGAGRHCIFLGRSGFGVVGVDVSRSALRMARKWALKEGLTNVAFVCGAMTNLPFFDSSFHAVISISVMHHAMKKDILRTVAEVHRILQKTGVLFANLASTRDPRYGKGKKVENDTFKILEAFEERRFEELHHYFSEREVSEVLAGFAKAEIEPLEEKPNYWRILAVK